MQSPTVEHTRGDTGCGIAVGFLCHDDDGFRPNKRCRAELHVDWWPVYAPHGRRRARPL